MGEIFSEIPYGIAQIYPIAQRKFIKNITIRIYYTINYGTDFVIERSKRRTEHAYD